MDRSRRSTKRWGVRFARLQRWDRRSKSVFPLLEWSALGGKTVWTEATRRFLRFATAVRWPDRKALNGYHNCLDYARIIFIKSIFFIDLAGTFWVDLEEFGNGNSEPKFDIDQCGRSVIHPSGNLHCRGPVLRRCADVALCPAQSCACIRAGRGDDINHPPRTGKGETCSYSRQKS